jgi:hypothetical protein
VEYRVTRNLSIVSKINDQIITQAGQVIQGGDELSVRWRHDFRDKTRPSGPPPARREPSRPLPAQPQAGGSPASTPITPPPATPITPPPNPLPR